MPILTEFIEATPSAELLPLSAGVQSDEVEMGLTYKELSDFGYGLELLLHRLRFILTITGS
jgi:NH3-dependent NAD+ synthetase